MPPGHSGIFEILLEYVGTVKYQSSTAPEYRDPRPAPQSSSSMVSGQMSQQSKTPVHIFSGLILDIFFNEDVFPVKVYEDHSTRKNFSPFQSSGQESVRKKMDRDFGQA